MSTPFVPIRKADITWKEDLPYSNDFADIYFSKEGGLAETRHVFIEGNNLLERWQNLDPLKKNQFVIGETGFGTGLNFLVTWDLWRRHARKDGVLTFFSCELHPLAKDDLKKCLALWPELTEYAEALLAQYPILTPGHHYLSFDEGRVKLILLLGDASFCYQELLSTGHPEWESSLTVDAWYLDGFAPAKNPSIWQMELLKTLSLLSDSGTTLATYTVAASVKEALHQAGFIVSKVPGFGSKRHMLRAEYQHPVKTERRTWTSPWFEIAQPKDDIEKKAIVIGAGLTGCLLSSALAKRGWEVVMIEEGNSLASGASGNPQAVLFPRLSAFQSPFTQLMLDAFVYALRFYAPYFAKTLNGLLILSDDEIRDFANLQTWLTHYPELGRIVDAKEASGIAGVSLDSPALFIPHSGWLDSRMLCQHFSHQPGIQFISDSPVPELKFEKNRWIVNEHKASTVVITNGYRANEFAETSHLPIKPMRGQMTFIKANAASRALKVPLCNEGHVLPEYQGLHAVGATYQLNKTKGKPQDEDDLMNLCGLKELAPRVEWSEEVVNHWVGVRASSPDYLPMVGPVAMAAQFIKDYAGFSSNAKRWIPKHPQYYPGLYVCAGFGSRGVTTIPYLTEWLASILNREPNFMPQSMIQSLSPQRFLYRDICRGSV